MNSVKYLLLNKIMLNLTKQQMMCAKLNVNRIAYFIKYLIHFQLR